MYCISFEFCYIRIVHLESLDSATNLKVLLVSSVWTECRHSPRHAVPLEGLVRLVELPALLFLQAWCSYFDRVSFPAMTIASWYQSVGLLGRPFPLSDVWCRRWANCSLPMLTSMNSVFQSRLCWKWTICGRVRRRRWWCLDGVERDESRSPLCPGGERKAELD